MMFNLCVGLLLFLVNVHAQFTPNPAYASFSLLADGAASFPGRDAHTAVIVNNTLVIAGGEDVNRAALNDVWISSPPDSGVFSQVNVTSPFTARSDHSTVVLGNKIIIFAGQFNGTSLYNDVWSSSDLGTTWTQIQPNAPWSGRIGSMAVVYNNAILMIGGFIETSTQNMHCSEVWRSTDGITWSLLSNNSFPGRADARVDVVGTALVMTGGENKPPNTFSEVWRSMDGGITWTLVTNSAPWGKRFQHSTALIGDQLILTTGLQTNFSVGFNDIWASSDAGTTWTLITQHANFAGRAHTETIVYQAASGPAFILTGGNKGGGRQAWIARGAPLLAVSSSSSSSTGVISSTGSSSSTGANGSAQGVSVSILTMAITVCGAWALL